jgi:hypothetical protein
MSFNIEFFASFMHIGLHAFEVIVHRPLTEDQVQGMIHILRTKLLGPANCNPEDFDLFTVKESLQDLFGFYATVYPTKVRYDDILHFIGSDTQELLIRVNEEAIPYDAIRDRFLETGIQEIKTPVAPHIHFCQNLRCDQTCTKKCAGCESSWYCSIKCQQADWPYHKATCKEIQQDRIATKLYAQIAERLGKDVVNYPYEEFKRFFKGRPASKDHTMADWMENWLEGWYTYDSERKQMLRSAFLANGLTWTSDVYPFYTEWANQRSGNRYEKIMAFVKEVRFMF